MLTAQITRKLSEFGLWLGLVAVLLTGLIVWTVFRPHRAHTPQVAAVPALTCNSEVDSTPTQTVTVTGSVTLKYHTSGCNAVKTSRAGDLRQLTKSTVRTLSQVGLQTPAVTVLAVPAERNYQVSVYPSSAGGTIMVDAAADGSPRQISKGLIDLDVARLAPGLSSSASSQLDLALLQIVSGSSPLSASVASAAAKHIQPEYGAEFLIWLAGQRGLRSLYEPFTSCGKTCDYQSLIANELNATAQQLSIPSTLSHSGY